MLFRFGACFLILGVIAGVPVGMNLLFAFLSTGGVAMSNLQSVAPGLLLWSVVVTALIWTGTGSIQQRRWARAIVLSVSGISIVFSALTLIAMSFLHAAVPAVMTTPPRRAGRAAAAGADGYEGLLTAALILLFGIVLPLVTFLAAAYVLYVRRLILQPGAPPTARQRD